MSEVLTTTEIRGNVAVNLRRLLDDREWSVATLIAKSGVPHNTVYRILRGENEPSLSHLAAICDVLGCSIDKIISEPPEFP